MPNKHTIVTTIYAQLGGGNFASATGLIMPILVHENPKLCEVTAAFRWKGLSRNGINCLEVTLVEATDTYRMTFSIITSKSINKHNVFNDVYCDMLCDIFTQETGIELIHPEFISSSPDSPDPESSVQTPQPQE